MATAPVQPARWPRYQPRRPEQTVLYRTVERYLPEFIEKTESAGRLPGFVMKEFEAYLRCGRAEYGFALCRCLACGLEHRVPFSCKRRGFCPSCLGRRMNDLSLHLVDHVVPKVPLRQWIVTLPWSLRYRLGYDRKACSRFIQAFIDALFRLQRLQAKTLFGLSSVRDAQPAAISVLQRFDSALRLNPHIHVLALDGIYTPDGQFKPLDPPTLQAVALIAQHTATAVMKELGTSLDNDLDPLQDTEPLLAHCYGASVQGADVLSGKAAVRLIDTAMLRVPKAAMLCAEVDGFQVHADVTVDGRNRQRLFSLCRYLTRPPVAQERLQERSDGRLVYRLKKPWADGTTAVVLRPLDLLGRLAAIVPPPRLHLLRYHGAFSGHAKTRSVVVVGSFLEELAPEQLRLPLISATCSNPHKLKKNKTPSRTPWAKMLARVFGADVQTCPACGGPMKILEFCTDPDSLDHLTPQTRAPPKAGSPPYEPQLALPLY